MGPLPSARAAPEPRLGYHWAPPLVLCELVFEILLAFHSDLLSSQQKQASAG